MKKKIIAAALAAVVAFNICTVRPRAAAAAGIALAVGSAAVFLMGVFTGQYDDTANGIGAVLENGVEGFEKAFIGTEKTFCGQVIESEDAWIVTGYKQICRTIQSWVDSGDATLDSDGNLHMDYNQYVELYNQLLECCDLTVDFSNIGVSYSVVSIMSDIPIPLLSVPLYSNDEHDFYTSIFPCYFSDNALFINADRSYVFICDKSDPDDPNDTTYLAIKPPVLTGSYKFGFNDLLSRVAPKFAYSSSNNTMIAYAGQQGGAFPYRVVETAKMNSWISYNFDDGLFYDVTTADVDKSLSTGYIVCGGTQADFISALRAAAVPNVHPNQDIDDLSNTLPLDKTSNPGLIISSDPSIAKATDAVTVTDVPGTDDTTLTNYMTEVDTDIDVPSIIIEKFPFCIPYDFIRIIGVLCADPEPPIFRIPISTNPDNLKGFEGNQTIGNIPDDFTPMFEIDEEIVIDLSAVPLVQPICYTIFIVGFVVLLIVLTPKLIQH